MACSNLIHSADGGFCSMSGRTLTDAIVGVRCETDLYLECPHYCTQEDEEMVDDDFI